MELKKRLDLFLTERRMTTKVELVRADRELKIAKGKDVGIELYPDFTKFLATYLNSLKGKELNPYRVINRERAMELVGKVASAHPNMQAVLDKLHLDPEAFVNRFWSKMDIKNAIQDAVKLLLKGEQNVVIATSKESKEEPVAEEKVEHKCLQCGKELGNEWILGPVCGKCVRANHKKATGRK